MRHQGAFVAASGKALRRRSLPADPMERAPIVNGAVPYTRLESVPKLMVCEHVTAMVAVDCTVPELAALADAVFW